MYKEKCVEDGHHFVKEFCYRKVFNEEYNLTFKIPSSDTCSTCDALQSTILHGETDAKKEAKILKDNHLKKSEMATSTLKNDTEVAKLDKTKCCIIFDLQKTMPTPHLQTNKVFYMRQLWTYNLGIHDAVSGKA